MHFCLNKFVVLFPAMLAACSDHNHTDDSHHHDVSNVTSEVSEVDHHHSSSEDNGSEAHGVTRSAESHTHGGAEMGFVIDGKSVIVEFETPLYNLVGFEHAPDTQVQKQRVKNAQETLIKGEGLFSFNRRSECRFISPNREISLFPKALPDDEPDTHKDVILRYEFMCENPEKLENVSINLFEFFDELTEIDVTYLGPTTQRQFSLNRENTIMELKL